MVFHKGVAWVFLNDVPYIAKNAVVHMYTDDSNLFCAPPTLVELRENLHVELQNLHVEFYSIMKLVKMNKE